LRIAASSCYRPNGRDCPGRLTGHQARQHGSGPRCCDPFRTQFHVLAATIAPEFCKSNSLEERGRRECRVPDAPAASYAKVKSTRVSHHRFAETIRHSLRDGFNGFLRALSGDRAFLSPSPVRCASIVTNLTPASRRQDHTTSPSTASPLVSWRYHVHRIPRSTFVTIAKRPSYQARNGAASKGDLPDGASEIFRADAGRPNPLQISEQFTFLIN
jgi:hypothetical protein